MRLPARLLGILLAWAQPGSASAASVSAAAALAAHHAVYTLTLKSSSEQGVLAASGTMSFELTDGCTGWTTAQQLLIHMTDRDGKDVTMLSDYAVFESKDGTSLTFHTRQMNDSEITASLNGTATLDHSGGRGYADYTDDGHRRIVLPPGTLLPTAHTLAILQAGRAGKRFLSMPLFDGTDADGAQDTFVTIEGERAPHTERWSALSGLPSDRVHVAFFDRDQTREEPDYEIGMRYFNNGVADDLAMNFGDFVMEGKLAQFELKRPPHC